VLRIETYPFDQGGETAGSAERLPQDSHTIYPASGHQILCRIKLRALKVVAATASRVRAVEDAQREAIHAAHEAGVSLPQIASDAGLSQEQVRRIVQGESVAPYFVTLERRGVAPLHVQLLVRAPSRRAAGELASWIAERERGGIFEATRIRRAARTVAGFPPAAFDDADL